LDCPIPIFDKLLLRESPIPTNEAFGKRGQNPRWAFLFRHTLPEKVGESAFQGFAIRKPNARANHFDPWEQFFDFIYYFVIKRWAGNIKINDIALLHRSLRNFFTTY
jgi:hypothetical protein